MSVTLGGRNAGIVFSDRVMRALFRVDGNRSVLPADRPDNPVSSEFNLADTNPI